MEAKTPHAGTAQPTRTALPEQVKEAFGRRFGRPPEILVRAPGRVNLLGAHVDYSEGWVLPAAIDRAVWLAASPAAGDTTRIHSLAYDATATLDLDRLPPPLPRRPGDAASWVDYPAGVAWALAEAGHRPAAIDAVFGGDVPIGAGVSSSAAVEMAFVLAFEAASGAGFGLDGAACARLGERAENGYLGVSSGVMDQFASLHGAARQAIFLDCRDLAFEHLPLPADVTVLVADSGVRRRLTDLGYNDRREECRQAVDLLRPHLPGIQTLRDVTRGDYELHSHHLPMTLRRRARHAIEECRRVRDGARALRDGNLAAFGGLMRRSHLSSRDLYEVSIPEIDTLAAAAWSATGCYGARLTGGGFGGCVTALAHTDAVDQVSATMVEAFRRQHGQEPTVFTCAVADGAGVVP